MNDRDKRAGAPTGLNELIAHTAVTRDGVRVVLYAYQRGFRSGKSQERWSSAPVALKTIRTAFLYLRYRLAYHGEWILDLREAHDGETIATGTASCQAEAAQAARMLAPALASLDLKDIAHLIQG